jgi:hypothetical protein
MPALQIRPALEALRLALVEVGFTGAHYDPERVNLPAAVWLQPRAVHGFTLAGGGTLTVWLYLLAGDGDDHGALLSKLDDSLLGIGELEGLTLADTEDQIDLTAAVLLPGYTTPLPAYRLAIDIDL